MALPPPSAGASAPKLSRRTLLIDRGFQLKYTVTLVLVGAGVSTLFGLMVYLAHAHVAQGITMPTAVAEEWDRMQWMVLMLTVAMVLLMAVALTLTGLLITHRVAGPVYVMSHYIDLLSQGRYPRMRALRKKDELKGFFERFQAAIESMRAREAEEAKTLTAAVEQLASHALTQEAQEALGALRALGDRKRDATTPAAPPGASGASAAASRQGS